MIPTYESLRIMDLTPVEEYDGIYFKRDDKYMPFDDVPLSGGKVRQACSLVIDNYEHIKNECEGLIATPTSMSSPQGVIIARVAKEFGFHSLVLYGGSNKKSILKNNLAICTAYLGAKLNFNTKSGYDKNIQANLKKRMEGGLKCFNVKFGINLTKNPNSIIKAIGHQVQNIPDNLDMLVIPCGSAITACGILWGLQEYNKKPKKIYLIQISGYSRVKEIEDAEQALNIKFPSFDFIIDKTYKYNKRVRLAFGGGYMDPIYESKAYDYMLKHLEYKGKKVLFWIIGDSQPVRDYSKVLSYKAIAERTKKTAITYPVSQNENTGIVDDTVETNRALGSEPVSLTESNEGTINLPLVNDIKPYIFSVQEIEDICKNVLETIEMLPNLKDQTRVEKGKGERCITLHKLVNQKKGVKWAQLNILNKECTDCELVLFRNGKKSYIYTKGSMNECLESANAVSYVI